VARENKDSPFLYPKDPTVVIVDFGGAILLSEDEPTGIVNTRQYRSPEVTLLNVNKEWNEKTDLWSVGCILMELYTGSLLFPTHDEVEHLAMIEKLCGPLPSELADFCNKDLKDIFDNDKYTEEEI